jgi:hypothetical protein
MRSANNSRRFRQGLRRVVALTCLALASASCGGASEYRYRPMTEGFGLHRALHHAFVRDGESVDLQVSDPEGRPIQGLALVIAAEDGPLTLISDQNGRLSFPVSSRLLDYNAAIELKRPPGIERFSMRLILSVDHACDRRAPLEHGPLARDFERWPQRDFGPDRVYAEASVAPEAMQRTGNHLAHARALFTELTGTPPPPIGVVISKVDGFATGSQDRAGRPIWRVAEAAVMDDSGLNTVVHEWTHGVMRQLLPGSNDERSRYVEDGLCELTSHLAYERAQATDGSPVAADRASELARFAKRPRFDLVALATQFSAGQGVTLFDQLAMTCSDTEVVVGYGLGLAFWLEQLDQNPELLRELFQRLRQAERPGGAALIEVSDAISRPRGALHDMVVERALHTLRTHQPQPLRH